jgi:cell division protein FtsL
MLLQPNEFNPENIKQLESALDQAWSRLLVEQPDYGTRPVVAAEARDRLGQAIFEGVRNGLRSPSDLADFALRAFREFRG